MRAIVLLLCALLPGSSDSHASRPVDGSSPVTVDVEVVVKYPHSNLPDPDSSSFFVRGSACGLSWDVGVQLRKGLVPDTWSTTLTCNSTTKSFPLKALYKDETWSLGGNTLCKVGSDPKPCQVFPWFSNTKGEYVQVDANLYSTYFHNFRDLVVYLPPSYPENTHKEYPTLLMHDGQNLFNDSTSFGGISWRCAQTITELIMQEKMSEIIVIGINNTPKRIDEYTYSYDKTVPGGGDGDQYLDFVFSTVLKYVNHNVPRALTDQENLSMLGSSLGGLISCYAGYTRPSLLRSVGCMSSSFWWNNEDFNGTVMGNPAPSPNNMTVYLDSGNAGTAPRCTSKDVDDCVQTVTVRTHFESLGWMLDTNLFYYLDVGGQHSEKFWGTRFHVPMLALYGSPQ